MALAQRTPASFLPGQRQISLIRPFHLKDYEESLMSLFVADVCDVYFHGALASPHSYFSDEVKMKSIDDNWLILMKATAKVLTASGLRSLLYFQSPDIIATIFIFSRYAVSSCDFFLGVFNSDIYSFP